MSPAAPSAGSTTSVIRDRRPVVPGFRIEKLIGRGGHSIVWKAVQESVGRTVALKILPFAEAADADRFAREVEASARMQHPHVVTCYDVGTCPAGLYLALHWMPGGDAAELVASAGPLPEVRVVAILADAARGLRAIADQGMVHRDIKPANILLDAEGGAHIGDLGLARDARSPGSLTRNSLIEGTPGFMSPEQVRGEPLDERSDIWSLAATGVFLATGRPPIAAANLPALLRAIATGPEIDLAAAMPDASPELRLCLATGLSRDLRWRYRQPADFAADLSAVAAGRSAAVARALRMDASESASGARPPPSVTTDVPRRLPLAAGLAVVGGLLGAAIGWLSGAPAIRPEVAALDAAIASGTPADWRRYGELAGSGEGRRLAEAAAATFRRRDELERSAAESGPEEQRLRSELAMAAQELARTLRGSAAPGTPAKPVSAAAPADEPTAQVAAEPTAAMPPAPLAAAVPVPVPTIAAAALPAPAGKPVAAKPRVEARPPVAPPGAIIPRPAVDAEAVLRFANNVPDELAPWVFFAELPREAGSLAGAIARPGPAGRLLVYCLMGMVLRSDDAGRTWLTSHPSRSEVRLGTVPAQWNPKAKQVFIPGSGSGAVGLLSIDDGETFTAVPGVPLDKGRTEDDFSLEDSRLMMPDGSIVAGYSDRRSNDWTTTLYRSTDRGATWKVLAKAVRDFALALPAGERLLLLAGSPVGTSIDLGRTFRALPAGMDAPLSACAQAPSGWVVMDGRNVQYIAADGIGRNVALTPRSAVDEVSGAGPRSLVIDPLTPSRWFVATADGRLLTSGDAGASWRASPIAARLNPGDALASASLAVLGGSPRSLVVSSHDRVLLLDLSATDRLFPVPATRLGR